MDRRKFVGVAGLAGAAGLMSACGKQAGSQAECSGESSSETFKWKMVTSWPRDFPGLGTGANRLVESINELSNGRLTIKVYGGNELVPPFEVFDAVSQGTAEMGHSATYYWKGKAPAAQFFAGIPFGMTAQELHGWIYYGGGLELWQEAYAPHGLVPFLAGSSGPQMGGWFNREINSLDDLKGLKMRIPGPGGEILKRAGGTPQTIPGAELFTDYPGWHEPGTGLECMINQQAWDSLPGDLQAIVKTACQAAVMDSLSDFTYNNGIALKTLIDKHNVQLRRFPDEVLSRLSEISDELIKEMADESELMGRIYTSFKAFQEIVNPWTDISDRTLLNLRP